MYRSSLIGDADERGIYVRSLGAVDDVPEALAQSVPRGVGCRRLSDRAASETA